MGHHSSRVRQPDGLVYEARQLQKREQELVDRVSQYDTSHDSNIRKKPQKQSQALLLMGYVYATGTQENTTETYVIFPIFMSP